MDKELNDLIADWNPMQEDYTDSQFNQYSSGPGAGLDPKMHQQKISLKNQQVGRNDGNKPYLVLKRLPKEMTTKAIFNICSSYGNVVSVRDSTKNDYVFVDLASVADMEAVYRALENNSYGFGVDVGKNFQNKSKDTNTNGLNYNLNPAPATMRDNPIDTENRNYQASKKNHPRPHVKSKAHVNSNDYNSSKNLLQHNDPLRHFLIEEDSHELERAGLVSPNEELNKSSKYKFSTGRAYIEMPKKTKSFVDAKNKQSIGQFDNRTGAYRNEQEKTHVIAGKCLECNRICDTICSRCSGYFCGVECQKKAWPKHRYVCGRPKHLNKNKTSPVEVDTNIPSPPDAHSETVLPKIPRSGNLVTITAISKPNVVFIRSKAYQDNMAFFKAVSAIQAYGKSFKPLRKLPKRGQIVVTRFNGLYNRAMILNLDDLNKIKVVYIDYGNLDIKLFDELLEAPQSYCELQRFAIPVILKNVPDVVMTDEIRKFMYSYLQDIDVKIKYVDEDFNEEKGAYQVELIDEATNQNFNKVIADIARPTESLRSDDIIYRDFLKLQLLPKGKNLKLIVMDNSLLCTGCISCTTIEYAQEIQRFQKELQIYAESLEERCYAPRVDELCIAKYSVDQKWYRGRCLDLVGDGHPTIVFFDYGNIALVNVKDIRPYPTQFSFPIYTFDCEIDGLPEHCNEKIVAKLEDLIPNGDVLECDKVEVFEEENFYVITLFDIIQKLKDDGLLV